MKKNIKHNSNVRHKISESSSKEDQKKLWNNVEKRMSKKFPKKSVGNTQAPIIIEKSGGGSGGVILPLIVLGVVGAGGYFGYKAWDKKREEKAIEKANEETLKHKLNIKKTDIKIANAERDTYVKGKNAFGKTVNVNLSAQVKEALNGFYTPFTDKYGTTRYNVKPKNQIDEPKIKSAIFNMPLNGIAKFDKWYSNYLSAGKGGSFLNDAQKLSPALYKQIKVIYEVSKKYKQVKGLAGRDQKLSETQNNLL